LKVAEAMRTNVVITDGSASVAEASMNMRRKGEGCAIVLREGRPFGIVTERDRSIPGKLPEKGLTQEM
jgi:CBS domain-containing protein